MAEVQLFFPEALKVDLQPMLALDEDKILHLVYHRCILSNFRPRVIRFSIASVEVDMKWTDLCGKLELDAYEQAMACPITGKKTRNIDVAKTAVHYKVNFTKLKTKLMELGYSKQIALEKEEHGDEIQV